MNEIEINAVDDSSFEDEKVTVNKINQEFKQEDKLKGLSRHYVIFNNIYCSQMVNKKHGGKQKFHVNLRYLDVKPQRIHTIAWNWLIAAGVFFVLSALFVFFGWFSSLQIDAMIVSISVSLAISLCVISLLMTILRTNDQIFLLSRHGKVPILEFQNNKPEKKLFEHFLNKLSAHIEKAQQVSGLELTQQLTLELKELRRLKDEKVLDEKLYEKAKNIIFSNSAF